MSFTGQLGTSLSKPSFILLGSIGSAPLTVSVSDNLHNWQDSIALRLDYLLVQGDTIILSDSFQLALGLNKTVSDNVDNWADVVSTFLVGVRNVSVADTLHNWNDAVEALRENTSTPQLIYKPFEVAYIRRYLNDVVEENLGTFSFPTVTIYKAVEIEYIRRYLNDV